MSTERAAPIALLAIGTLLGLAVGEAGARLARGDRPSPTAVQRFVESERGKFARYDPELGWAGRPDVRDHFEWIDARHEVVQNRFGFRGRAWPHARSDARRVVFLGDSFTWGFGVGEAELFTQLLEDRAGGALEVVNLGVSGYGNDQELLLWQREGRRWSPDTTVVMVTLNSDFWDNAEAERYGYAKPRFEATAGGRLELTGVPVPRRAGDWSDPTVDVEEGFPSPVRWLLRSSALVGLTLQAASRNDAARRFLEAQGLVLSRRGGYDGEHELYLTTPGPETERRWRLLFAILDRLAADVKRSGAQVRIVLVPSVVLVYPDLWDAFRSELPPPVAAGLDPAVPGRRFAAWAERTAIPFTDLLPALRAAGANDPYLYFPENRHWTPAGHRAVAQVLQELPM